MIRYLYPQSLHFLLLPLFRGPSHGEGSQVRLISLAGAQKSYTRITNGWKVIIFINVPWMGIYQIVLEDFEFDGTIGYI
jgi:hypothetical protein